MGILLGSIKMAKVLLRNQLRMKPLGRQASRSVIAFLRERGIPFRTVEVWMGLAEPEGLSCLVFFTSDAALEQFISAGHAKAIGPMFREALSNTGYPDHAVPLVNVACHSDETIRREGGYRAYFA